MKHPAIPTIFSMVVTGATLYAQGANGAAQLPDAPGRDTVKRICGACHAAENVLGKGMSREQWGGIVSNMISRGAKGTDAEFAQIVDYLATNLPANRKGDAGAVKRKRGGSLIDQAG